MKTIELGILTLSSTKLIIKSVLLKFYLESLCENHRTWHINFK